MSHHLDSPLSRADARLNITDLYVFRGRLATVLAMDVNTSAAGLGAAEGFRAGARYEFNIDVNGDAVAELTFRVTFGEPDAEGRQEVQLSSIAEARGSDAEMIASGLTDNEIPGSYGIRAWAGRAAEPFYIDARVLRAVGAAFKSGSRVNLSGFDPTAATDLFQATDICAVVLEIPDAFLERFLDGSRVLGIWATTSLGADAGGWCQINRAGRPLMQPIFNPDGGESASVYNTTKPVDDRDNYAERFIAQLAAVVDAQGTTVDPRGYAETIIKTLLPDVLPYQVGTQANFGFAAHNGRALSDNTPEVMFSLVTNSAIATGLDRHSPTGPARKDFPYVAARSLDPI